MIEHVESYYAELRFRAFPEFNTLANGEIDVVETGIAENVATHGAEGVKTIGNQNGIAHHVAIACRVQSSQRACTNFRGRVRASRGNGARAGRIGSKPEARKPIRTDGLEIGRIAKENPAVGQYHSSEEVIRLIIAMP